MGLAFTWDERRLVDGAGRVARRGPDVQSGAGTFREGARPRIAARLTLPSLQTPTAEPFSTSRPQHTLPGRLAAAPALTVARPEGPRMWNCSCTCSLPSLSLYSLRAAKRASRGSK